MATILHIEDEARNRLLVRKLLAAVGHEVIDAENGLQGVQLARQCAPDLVLVDLNVPDLDGYEVILRLRGLKELKEVPLVAITAEGNRQATLAIGADGFLAKPIDAARFAGVIGDYLKGHRERPLESSEDHLRQRTQLIVERLEARVQSLLEVNQRLEEMMRLRREFLRNVSHELATPLTPMVGYLKLLLDGEMGPLADAQRKSLRAVDAATQRLRAVVDMLVDVSALEVGRMNFSCKPYDLAEVVGQALAESRGRLEERGLKLLEEPRSSSMPAWGDADKLKRSLVHLLDNATKFSNPGGTVAVGIRRGQAADAEQAWYEVLVADEGPGVEAQDQQRILEAFVQGDGSPTRQHGGVGLGLAFARKVAEALGGGITVESPPTMAVGGMLLSGTLLRLRVRVRSTPSTAAASSSMA